MTSSDFYRSLLPMAQSEHDAARLTVRLGALKENYRELQKRSGAAKVAPVVKADGYGLGAVPVARALAEHGADTFFVARIEEGIQLRKALTKPRIFVLDGLMPGTAQLYRQNNLTPVLNSLDEIVEWSVFAARERATLDAAIQINTGMNRSGLSQEDATTLAVEAKQRLASIKLALILSHLACSDDPKNPKNKNQLERFRAALAALPSAPASLAASGGVGLGRDYAFDMVRPGIALYGGNPQPAQPNPYRVVARLTGRVLQIRHVGRGETVGYGATFTAERDSMCVTVALGYADGVMRALGGRGDGALAGVKMPYAGRVSMDLCVFDASRVPQSALKRGAEVEIFGDTISLDDMAAKAGTVNYEILTRIAPRVPRVYVEGAA